MDGLCSHNGRGSGVERGRAGATRVQMGGCRGQDPLRLAAPSRQAGCRAAEAAEQQRHQRGQRLFLWQQGHQRAKAGQQYNPDGTKKVSKDVEEFGEGLKKSLGTVDSQQAPLNCAVAVDNIHYQADLMLEVGQKNVRDGYMTQAAFDATAPKIREAKGKYSVSDCQGASGNKKSFYQCMSSSKNHVTGCDKQHKH